MTCEVFNDGPGFEAVIEVRSSYGRGGHWLVPVELPSNTRKRLFIPVFGPSAGYQGWDVRLLDERNRVRAEHVNLRPQQHVSAESHLIAAVPRTAAGLPVLPELPQNRSGLRPGVARLAPDLVPDNPLLFEGVSAFYLNAERAPDLKAPQVNALLTWLNGGGHLIVAVEQPADVNATPWLRNLLPGSLGAVQPLVLGDALHSWLPHSPVSTASTPGLLTTAPLTNSAAKKKTKTTVTQGRLPALAPDARVATSAVPVVRLTAAAGAEVLLAAGDAPLIVRGPVQRGRVTVLMFSPEREPFLSWPHRQWFWRHLAGVPADLWTRPDDGQHYGRHLDAVFGALVESRQVGKLPFLALLALLLGYLLVIGPGERYVLKRLRREMWTWITFPLIVAGFSALIYFIGYKLRAGDTEWNELHVVDVLRRGEGALLRGRTYGSVYSSGNQTYRFAGDAAGPGALRGESHAGGSGGFASDDSRIITTGEGFRAELRVPVWTSQLLAHDWYRTAPTPPLTFAVRQTTNEWQVEVHNRLPRALAQARLVAGGQWHDLGPVAAGEKKTIKVTRNAGASLRSFVQGQWPDIEQAVNARQSSFDSGGSRELPPFDAVCAASFHSLAASRQNYQSFQRLAGFDLADAVEAGDTVLLAWVPDHAARPPLNQFTALRASRHSVFRAVTTPTSATPATP
jgi:hypothetical protein